MWMAILEGDLAKNFQLEYDCLMSWIIHLRKQ
jgi:hypothetical protein